VNADQDEGANMTEPKNMTELSATAAVEAMRNGDIRAEDYARTLLDKAQEFESLNAFRILDHEMVLEAARAADKARASGTALGMLHGLPIPVKDSVNTKDLPTSQGTGALRDFKPGDDAAVLKPLFAQGAILMGKTNLHELSYGWTSNNEIFGPIRNPYNRDRVPGGSSGGSGTAVAARIAPLAIAEDTLGSIRVPATMCGLAGFRPTFRRYPNAGLMPLTGDKFDQVGALARCVADLSLFDTALTGDCAQVSASSLKGVRIGISPEYFWSGLDPEVDRVSNEAVRKLSEAGATLVTAEIPEIAKIAKEIASIIIAYDTLPSISDFLEEQGTGLNFEQMLEQASEEIQATIKGFALPPNRPSQEVYESMLAKREDLRKSIWSYFEAHGIVALAFPPIMVAPTTIGKEGEVDICGQKVSMSVAMSRNLSLGSCASMASLVLPAGMTSDGLPVGMEFDALMGNDRALLSLGVLFEEALGPIPGPVLY
jgi:Asp-tRNA(Asn)/Glu-tRNA(Gln) amidotransferase A subunit family amidase